MSQDEAFVLQEEENQNLLNEQCHNMESPDVDQSSDIYDLFAALSKAQGALNNASKDTEGHGYKYAQLSQIIDICRKPLSDNGLAVIQMPSSNDASCSVTTMITHSSGQWIKDTLAMPIIIPLSKDGKELMNHAQAVGNVITYARRYALAAFMNIAQEDTDAGSGDGGYKNSSKMATLKQQEYIKKLIGNNWNWDDFGSKYKVSRLGELTATQASDAIDYLQKIITPGGCKSES
ncbi:MAG: ERF family protein [Maribacter sp.]|nr:ERF family protein [Maribacter sp.]